VIARSRAAVWQRAVVSLRVAPALRAGLALATLAFAVAALGLAPSALAASGWSAPSPVDAEGNGMDAISCTSASFCMAVDEAGNAFNFNGSSWSGPTKLTSAVRGFNSVSCASSSLCVAIDAEAYAWIWDGSGWSRSPEPLPGWEAHGLAPVSCAPGEKPILCAAIVGGDLDTFNGSSWSGFEAHEAHALEVVSCASSSFCVAVDEDEHELTFNGITWKKGGAIGILPVSLSCSGEAFCVAVNREEAVIRSGGSWGAPADIDREGAIEGVSCASGTFCVAVDHGGNALTFNGSSWSAPNPIEGVDTGVGLSGVSCPSSSFCAAFNAYGFVVTYTEATTPPPAGGTTSTSSTSTSTSSAPVAPTAELALATPNPRAGKLLELSGAGSQPGSGRIVAYEWGFKGEQISTDTGTDPDARLMFAAGTHTVTMTTINSYGLTSTTHLTFNIPITEESGCSTSLELENVHLLAQCIKTVSTREGNGAVHVDEYVITTGTLEINGLLLEAKNEQTATFKIKPVEVSPRVYALELSGPRVNIVASNLPGVGELVFGERNLEAEPITLHEGDADAAAAGSSKTLLFAFRVGHECSSGSKETGCCPPTSPEVPEQGERHGEPGVSCATLPGEFPLTGQIAVYVTGKTGQLIIEAQVGLNLKSVGFEATGAIDLNVEIEKGIELSSLQFKIGEASLGSVFKVKEAEFAYYWPGCAETAKCNSWQAKATLEFEALGNTGDKLKGELVFKKGNFHSAALVLQLGAGQGIPIFPGVELNKFGGAIGVEPFSIGGTLGASVGTQLEVTLEFKFHEATSSELGFFGGKGSIEYEKHELGSIAGDVYTDGYTDASIQAKISVPFGSNSPYVKLAGGLGYWDEPSSGLWQAQGNVQVEVLGFGLEGAGLVNNNYLAGCVRVNFIVGSWSAYGYYRFANGETGGNAAASNQCSEELKPYQEKPLHEHKGGFVGEGSSLLPGFPGTLDDTRSVARAAAGEATQAFTLPSGTFAQALRIKAASGTPVVTLLGPGGQSFTTASPAARYAGNAQFLSIIPPYDPNEVLVTLRNPQGGEWRIQPAAGSPAIEKLEVAEATAPASVSAHVSHRGHRWSLAYRIAHLGAGTHVMFVERGHDSTHVLGTVSASRGTLVFRPEEALGRSRSIVAYLSSASGAPTRELTAGHYTAPAAFRPARPPRLRLVRRGTTALLSWGAVAGAREYRVRVSASNGSLRTFFASAAHRSETIENVLPFESVTATVTPVAADELAGPRASVKLAAAKSVKRVPARPRRAGKHHS